MVQFSLHGNCGTIINPFLKNQYKKFAAINPHPISDQNTSYFTAIMIPYPHLNSFAPSVSKMFYTVTKRAQILNGALDLYSNAV